VRPGWVVIAATGSGAGKTTISCALMAALRARGLSVAPFKVGPDYLDPTYHTLACGRPGRNLDAFLSGPELIAPLARHGARGADIAVVEGVMGLFDGASGRGELASTAQVAKLLGAPVVLVVDASGMARSLAALVHGFCAFDPELRVAGVIANRVGSEGHARLLAQALEPLGLPLLGALPRDPSLRAPERHLGLVPAGSQSRSLLDGLAHAAQRHIDLQAVVAIAQSARPPTGPQWSPCGGGERVRIALARGPAFSFYYQENLELLAAAGAELAEFDPLSDRALPAGAAALVLAGGFPECHGAALADNAPLRAQVRAFTGPVLAECGGLLFLCRSLDGHAMCGALPLEARMTNRLTLGYRQARALTATPWLAAGSDVRGHEFHYSQLAPAGAQPETEHAQPGTERTREATERTQAGPRQAALPLPAWTIAGRGEEGYVSGAIQASYLHMHWAAFPEIPRRFVEAAARHAASRRVGAPTAREGGTLCAREGGAWG